MLLFLGLVLAIAALAGFVVYRQALRVAALAAERERLAASLDELGTALGSGPTALYLFGPTGERFFPGTLSALGTQAGPRIPLDLGQPRDAIPSGRGLGDGRGDQGRQSDRHRLGRGRERPRRATSTVR